MNILFIGDVVGKPGRKVLKHCLEELIEEYNVDFVVANLENASHGKGLCKSHFLEMLKCGIDVVTLGNHYSAKKEIFDYIDDYDNLLRPANIHHSINGHGSDVYNVNGINIRVTNLMGRVYMSENVSNPFDTLQDIVSCDDSDIHIVDFHAEATGEKLALAWAFDGKVTAVLGTHTHVQTNDLRLLNKGTLYISDVGMCGPYNGILGTSRQEVIERTWTGSHSIFQIQEDDEFIFSAVYFNYDENTKEIIEYKKFYKIVEGKEM